MSKKYPKVVSDFLILVLSGTNKKYHAEITEEMLSHFEDACEQDLKNGLSTEESFLKTIGSFGDPKSMGAQFKKAHRVWYLRWTYLLPSTVGLAFLLTCVFATSYASYQISHLRNSFDRDEIIRRQILEGHRQLKASDSFFGKTFTEGRDAGAYLNRTSLWAGHPIGPVRIQILSKIPGNLPACGSWDRCADLLSKNEIDFSWMAKLSEYDYWDLYATEGVGRDHLKSEFHQVGFAVPDFLVINFWARLRLIDGIAKKDPLPALLAVRKLAELVYSTENISGTAVAIGILKMINDAYKESVSRGLLKPNDWQPIVFDLSDRARVLAWAVNHWTDVFASNQFKEELYSMQPFLGSCGAINEAAYGVSGLVSFPLVNSPYVFENSMDVQIKDFKSFVSRQETYCRLTFAKYLIAHPEKNPFPIETGDTLQDLWFASYKVPYIRQYMMAEAASYARPNWLMAYENYLREVK